MPGESYCTQFSAVEVDKSGGVIRGVSVITEGVVVRKDHEETVDQTTLAQIAQCAQQYASGLKVVGGHTKPGDSVFATIGYLRNFRVEGKQLRADLHLLESDEHRQKLLEMAQTIPDTFGLSIAFSGKNETKNGTQFTRCSEIYNAALVDMPAANPNGLFASEAGHVDASNKVTLMDQKEMEGKIAELQGKLEAAISKYDAAFAALPKPESFASATAATELSKKLDDLKTELSAKVNDRKELVQEIAKQFAAVVGTSHQVTTDGAGDSRTKDPTKLEKFQAAVVTHFKATKSKTKALEMAIREESEGYEAWKSSNTEIKYA